MAIDPHYIPAFSIEDVLLDKDTGAPLAGGQVFFYRDSQRGTLKPVYQITGTSPNYSYIQLPNPMILSSIGTFVDALDNPTIPYFKPFVGDTDVPDYYFVRVLSSGDVEQFTREAVPYIPNSGTAGVSSAFENEISNPQFAEVYFDTTPATFTYSFSAASSQVVTIAPDWDIVVSSAGAATVTVSQLKPAGSLNRITNPGTLLTITSSGVSSLILRQRLYGSPNLWGSGKISCTFIAKTYSGTDTILTLNYSQSNGTIVSQLLSSATLPASGDYAAYPGNVTIPASDSNQTFPDAYIDIYFNIPAGVQVDISSVMVVGTGDTSVADIVYDQESNNRQIDHLFHWYKPGLVFKPVPSLLTGWDFPLNPRQFGATVIATATPGYGLDQTIIGSITGNVTITKNASTGGMTVVNASALEAVYLLQYLSGAQAQKIIGSSWAVNLQAWCNKNDVVARVYLYRGSAAATFPILPTTIGTIANTGLFTLTAANWTLINRVNQPLAQAVLANVALNSDINKTNIDHGFYGWEVVDNTEIGDTNKFAIVVTFQIPTISSTLNVSSISLVPGAIPTRPAPQSQDEVLRECQYYYETSYNLGVTAGTINQAGALSIQRLSGNDCLPLTFQIPYRVQKRAAPSSATVGIYNTTLGTLGSLRAFSNVAGGATTNGDVSVGTNWTFSDPTANYCVFGANTSNVLATQAGATEAYITYNWSADARLGIL